MGRRAVMVGAVLALVAVPVACSRGGDRSAEVEGTVVTVPEEDQRATRTSERTYAGLRTLVVRPTGPGSWPLVVFVHGAGAPPDLYAGLLEDLAAEGHVVVAPAMPGSVDDAGMAALFSLPFQPARISQVIDAVTGGPNAIRAVAPDRVAVVGHSLGAMAALATAYHSCCTDPRVDAVVSVAGRLASFPNGLYHAGSVPLLLVHGAADDVVAYAGSRQALNTVGTTAFLLTVEEGDHGSYLDPDDEAHPAVRDALVAFLRATAGGEPRAGFADLVAAGNGPGVRLGQRT